MNSILDAIQNLSLVVKGNLDNAEPIFIVGGIGDYKTHYFENVVNVKESSLIISRDLINKIKNGYNVGLMKAGNLSNEEEIEKNLKAKEISVFFDELREEVKAYYESIENKIKAE